MLYYVWFFFIDSSDGVFYLLHHLLFEYLLLSCVYVNAHLSVCEHVLVLPNRALVRFLQRAQIRPVLFLCFLQFLSSLSAKLLELLCSLRLGLHFYLYGAYLLQVLAHERFRLGVLPLQQLNLLHELLHLVHVRDVYRL